MRVGHQRFVTEAFQQPVDPQRVGAGFEHHPHRRPRAEVLLELLDGGAHAHAFHDVSFQIEQADVGVLVTQVQTGDDVHALLDHLVLRL